MTSNINWKICNSCQVKFSLLKKKITCFKCKLIFCSNCANHQLQIPKFGHTTPVHYCTFCFIEACVELEDKPTLTRMSMKELRRFCSNRKISTTDCFDNTDVANLIFSHLRPPSPTSPTQSPIYERESESSSSNLQGDRIGQSAPTSPAQSSSSPQFSFFQNSNSMPTSPSVFSFSSPQSYTPPIKSSSSTPMKTLEEMVVGDLKLILINNGIDYSDCLEKNDLLAKIDKFCPEVRNSGSNTARLEVPDKDACVVCMERRIDSVLLECGHLAVCFICSKHLKDCPICRKPISRVVHTFHANK